MMTLHKQQTSKRKRTREDVFVDSLIYFITFIILVLVLYPLVYVLSASISEPRLVTTGKLILLPKQITFEGYEKRIDKINACLKKYGINMVASSYGKAWAIESRSL